MALSSSAFCLFPTVPLPESNGLARYALSIREVINIAESLRDLVVSLSLNTDNFTRNIKSVNKQIQEAESYFKLASAGMKGFDTSAAGLSAKLETLERKLSLQKDAVGQYEKALKAASDKLTECYTRQQDYANRLAEAKQKQADMASAVENATAKYEELRNSLGESDSATIAAKANMEAAKEEYAEATAEVTDSRGRTATYSTAFNVLDYSYPSIRQFKAERCNSDGSAAQLDGNKVRYSFQGGVASLGNMNALSYVVYYKLNSASAWTQAESMAITSYDLSTADKLLSQTYDPLASYDLKVRLSDYFYYVEQAVSIGTKGVIMDILSDGTGIAFGKVAEESGHAEFGWPLKLSSPLAIQYGGTGASSSTAALAALGAVKKSGDTMTGNLTIQSSLYPSVYLKPTYNDTANRTVFEGSYLGASSFASWEDSAGNNRRMLEVRTKAYENSLDNAVLLRVADNGAWSNYRVFHSGMASPVPVASGGTGAINAVTARQNLGANDAGNLTIGTLQMARLPFKVAYGSGSVSGSSALTINYASAGFTAVPCVIVTYSTTGSNWSGDNGALKVYSKTTTGATIIVGGSFNTSRQVDWLAIGA